jgi:hypothetical protein
LLDRQGFPAVKKKIPKQEKLKNSILKLLQNIINQIRSQGKYPKFPIIMINKKTYIFFK